MRSRSRLRNQKRKRNNFMLVSMGLFFLVVVAFVIIKPNLVFQQSQEKEKPQEDKVDQDNHTKEKEVEQEPESIPITAEMKKVALTFDDGPAKDTTSEILALLDKYNAKATFFMLGERVEQYPEIALSVYEQGHEIGNHTYNHLDLTKQTFEEVTRQYQDTDDALMEAIGEVSTVFRPPYGAKNDQVESIIPIPVVNWTIDTYDWKHRNPEQILAIIEENLQNDSIILMHDIHASTANGLEAVLKYLTEEGYHFVTVSEILPFR